MENYHNDIIINDYLKSIGAYDHLTNLSDRPFIEIQENMDTFPLNRLNYEISDAIGRASQYGNTVSEAADAITMLGRFILDLKDDEVESDKTDCKELVDSQELEDYLNSFVIIEP